MREPDEESKWPRNSPLCNRRSHRYSPSHKVCKCRYSEQTHASCFNLRAGLQALDMSGSYYHITVRHDGLGKYRVIRGAARHLVEAAAHAQQRAWNEQYAKKEISRASPGTR